MAVLQFQVSLGRAARTDAGVHAAGNVVSLKLITSIPSLNEAGISLVTHINSCLPPQIRVWDILRTTNNFKSVLSFALPLPYTGSGCTRYCAKAVSGFTQRTNVRPSINTLGLKLIKCIRSRSCDSRIYEYLFPSYILIPPHSNTPLATRLPHIWSPTSPSGASSSNAPPRLSFSEANTDRESFRCSQSDIIELRALLKQLEGTHNFHNYTVGREFRDRAAQRYMIKLEASVLNSITPFKSSYVLY